jgi:NAD(P)-dependent dehydrogenase (short-subunit alcohol dehydrogenase family)
MSSPVPASLGATVVTGANRGIGLELARQLVAAGHAVVAAVRAPSPELEALDVEVELVHMDDPASVDGLAERLSGRAIGLLIHNAGILRSDRLGEVTPADVLDQLRVNALGPVLLTQALQQSLVEGGRVAIITSRMGSIADNTSGGMYGYRMSKAAVNAAGRSLAHDLASKSVAVGLFHPGFVRTDMTGGRGMVEADESAAGLLAQIAALGPATTGSFVHMNGEALPW